MIPELGHLALIVALVIAVVQATLPLVGAARGHGRWMSLASSAAQAQFALIAFASGCLAHAFAVNDFSVTIVSTHSNAQLPLHYRLAATWGSHQGSLLLWILILGGWGCVVASSGQVVPRELRARVVGVLGLIGVGFLLFLLTTSNPFERLVPAAFEGRDLNPVLQDWGMIVHPPMLYMGYVGFAVTFAFAIAALLGDPRDLGWVRTARPWATAAWCFLTIGIALGSWWAYRVLGWGGWWFWDPVENASLIPWLVGTALIHALAATERRGVFRNWTVLLAIGAFSMSLLGTFLVRSGVLSSVHAFSNDPKRGVFLLVFLTLAIGGSLALFAWRAPRAADTARFDAVSRETALLANNLLLIVATGTVLLGTLYPLALDALDLGKISVGTPYFETVFVPLIVPLAILTGLGPLLRWKTARPVDSARRLRWVLVASVVAAIAATLLSGGWLPWVASGLSMSAWIFATSAVNLLDRVGFDPHVAARLATQPRRYYGMLAAHCGLAVFIAGVTLVKGHEIERDVTMRVGDSVALGDYRFRFDGAAPIVGPNYTGSRGTVDVIRDGSVVDTLYPEKRIFNVQRAVTTEAAIRSRPSGDLYVSLGESLGDGAWSVRIYSKPFVGWIWGGCLLMAIGGFLAVSDRGRRQRASTTVPVATQAA